MPVLRPCLGLGLPPDDAARLPILEMNFAAGQYRSRAPGRQGITSDLAHFLSVLDGTFSRASEKRVRAADGRMIVAAAAAPAFEFDPDGNPLGILIEDARQNRVANSEAVAVLTGVTIGNNVAMAPDGTTTADKIVETTANSFHAGWFADGVGTPADNAIVSGSVFLKAAERSIARVTIVKKNGSSTTCTYDLATGAVSAVSQGTGGGSATAKAERWIAPDGGVWWRVCMENVDVLTGATAPHLRVFLVTGTLATPVDTYTGDGASGLFAWGGQIELADAVSSYIRTTGSTATRAADLLWVPTTGIVPAVEGVIVVKGRVPNAPAGVENRVLASLDDGTFSNRIQIRRGANSPSPFIAIASGGATLFAAAASGSAFADGEAAGALRFRAGDYAWSFDGGAVETNAAAAVPPFTRLVIGAASFGLNRANGHISYVALRHRAGVSADLPILSAAA